MEFSKIIVTIPDEKKDAYDLAIELDFELGLRIAKLKAIKHCDIVQRLAFLTRVLTKSDLDLQPD